MKEVIYYGHSSSLIFGKLIQFKTTSLYNHGSVNMGGRIFEASAIRNGVVELDRKRDDICLEIKVMFKDEDYDKYLDWLIAMKSVSEYEYKVLIYFLLNRDSRNSNPNYVTCDEVMWYPFEHLMGLSRPYKISKKRSSPKSALYYINGFASGKEYYAKL
mgnify:CR=1 FL=1|tara:strand:+ start:1269 stop:1745 length:477 start_codon:yes stop_codon:yes gene_type:complete